jgi:hypothetical protein
MNNLSTGPSISIFLDSELILNWGSESRRDKTRRAQSKEWESKTTLIKAVDIKCKKIISDILQLHIRN